MTSSNQAGVRAFSLTTRITQHDDGEGYGRAGKPHPRSGARPGLPLSPTP